MSSPIVIEDDEENENEVMANISNGKCTTVAVLKEEEDESMREQMSNGMNDNCTVKNQTNDQPAAAKSVSDEKWFASLPTTELEFYKEHLLSPDTEGFVVCTACFGQINHKHIGKVRRHPVLGVPVCKSCFRFYHSGAWSRDEDGFFEHCRWCANGGDLLCCDTCSNAFCRKCIKRNLGRRKLTEMEELERWSCLVCDPSQVLTQRSVYFSVWRYQQQLLNGGKFDDDFIFTSCSSDKKTRFIATALKEGHDVNKILGDYLDQAKKSWSKKSLNYNDESVTKVVSKLRTIMKITHRNLE